MLTVQSKEVYLLFGLSGAGKSSTINTISRGSVCSVSAGGTSETRNCHLVQVNCSSSVFHEKYLLDMQGFHDTRMEETTQKLFEKMKLYFLESGIIKVQAVIFVVSLTTDRTDFYEKFAAFLGELFTQQEVKRNAILLLTKGTQLQTEAKEEKLAIIQQEVSRLKQQGQWSIEILEWSNKKPFIDQEKKLFDAAVKLPGFSVQKTLETMQREINEKAEKAYKAPTNQTKTQIPVSEWKMIDDFQYSNETEVQNVLFEGNFIDDELCPGDDEGVKFFISACVRIGAPVLGVVNKFSGEMLLSEWPNSKTLYFQGEVKAVKLTVVMDDILHDKGKLNYSINGKEVSITSSFSKRPTNLIHNYDVEIRVEASTLVRKSIQRMVECKDSKEVITDRQSLNEIRERIARLS